VEHRSFPSSSLDLATADFIRALDRLVRDLLVVGQLRIRPQRSPPSDHSLVSGFEHQSPRCCRQRRFRGRVLRAFYCGNDSGCGVMPLYSVLVVQNSAGSLKFQMFRPIQRVRAVEAAPTVPGPTKRKQNPAFERIRSLLDELLRYSLFSLATTFIATSQGQQMSLGHICQNLNLRRQSY
jgi:hypothetical protein